MVAGLVLAGCSTQDDALDDGWSMIAAQDYGAARAHYQSMLAENPNDPYVNLNLGVAYEETCATSWIHASLPSAMKSLVATL